MSIESSTLNLTICNPLYATVDVISFIQPNSKSNGGNGQLCSGGQAVLSILIEGCPGATYYLTPAVSTQSGQQPGLSVTLPASGSLTVGYTTGSISADCFDGGCLGGCNFTISVYVWDNSSENTLLLTSSPSNRIYVDCSCS